MCAARTSKFLLFLLTQTLLFPAAAASYASKGSSSSQSLRSRGLQTTFKVPGGGPLTDSPSDIPSSIPSSTPSGAPSDMPSSAPSDVPTSMPSEPPSSIPSGMPSVAPSDMPSAFPTFNPTGAPTIKGPLGYVDRFLRPIARFLDRILAFIFGSSSSAPGSSGSPEDTGSSSAPGTVSVPGTGSAPRKKTGSDAAVP